MKALGVFLFSSLKYLNRFKKKDFAYIPYTFLQWNMETASYKVLMEGYVRTIYF